MHRTRRRSVALMLALLATLAAASTAFAQTWKETEAAARTLRVQPQLLEVRTPDEFPGAYAAMIRERANALVIVII